MKHYDIIIIGGGPAGLTAALYALRSGCKVLLFEGEMLGGQCALSSEVSNFPAVGKMSGADLALKMHAQAEELGLETLYEKVEKVDLQNKVIITEYSQYSCTCVVLSMGAKARKLNVKNEKEFFANGVHYCAVCDGNFYKGKDVVVIGGGNSAVEDTLYLVNICHHVTVVNKNDKFKAQKYLLQQFEKLESQNKITVYRNAITKEILADNKVTGILIQDNKKLINIPTDGVFVVIGREPDNAIIKDQLKLNKQGFVIANDKMQTSIEGVYVAGDLREKDLRQIITACSDGAIAGTEASIFVNKRR